MRILGQSRGFSSKSPIAPCPKYSAEYPPLAKTATHRAPSACRVLLECCRLSRFYGSDRDQAESVHADCIDWILEAKLSASAIIGEKRALISFSGTPILLEIADNPSPSAGCFLALGEWFHPAPIEDQTLKIGLTRYSIRPGGLECHSTRECEHLANSKTTAVSRSLL